MPRDYGSKRKAYTAVPKAESRNSTPAPPDRSTWPGWVEMESEPALFNVMLKEMGIRGVRVQEVYSLDHEMLAILPQPVHALIFLFRYRTADREDQSPESTPKHVWFANQVPDFACATVAMLNIVNNIPGLEMGKELRDFKTFTKDMDPLSRGETIDSFDFVRTIHNSFARQSDLLAADFHTKNKVDRAKRQKAAHKARETKAARKAEKPPLTERSAKITSETARKSLRTARTIDAIQSESPEQNTAADNATHAVTASDHDAQDADFQPGKDGAKKTENEDADMSDCPKPRRSGRAAKPRLNINALNETLAEDDDQEEGFHFVAYMPVGNDVWKLDGLDSHPHHIGSFELSDGETSGIISKWLGVAQPRLLDRMAQFEGTDIEYNLMAVVHDSSMQDKQNLLQNIKSLQAIDARLDTVVEDWRELDGAETKREVLVGDAPGFSITQADIDAVTFPLDILTRFQQEDRLFELLEIRKEIICGQAMLKGSIRDALASSNDDEDKARHRRHDYSSFVRGWLSALAEEGELDHVLQD